MTVSGRCHIWGQGVQLAGGEPQPTKYPSFRTRARKVEGQMERLDYYANQGEVKQTYSIVILIR